MPTSSSSNADVHVEAVAELTVLTCSVPRDSDGPQELSQRLTTDASVLNGEQTEAALIAESRSGTERPSCTKDGTARRSAPPKAASPSAVSSGGDEDDEGGNDDAADLLSHTFMKLDELPQGLGRSGDDEDDEDEDGEALGASWPTRSSAASSTSDWQREDRSARSSGTAPYCSSGSIHARGARRPHSPVRGPRPPASATASSSGTLTVADVVMRATGRTAGRSTRAPTPCGSSEDGTLTLRGARWSHWTLVPRLHGVNEALLLDASVPARRGTLDPGDDTAAGEETPTLLETAIHAFSSAVLRPITLRLHGSSAGGTYMVYADNESSATDVSPVDAEEADGAVEEEGAVGPRRYRNSQLPGAAQRRAGERPLASSTSSADGAHSPLARLLESIRARGDQAAGERGSGGVLAIFKPRDEEIGQDSNPHGNQDSDRMEAFTPGSGSRREVLAYCLDHGGFAGIPPTLEAATHCHLVLPGADRDPHRMPPAALNASRDDDDGSGYADAAYSSPTRPRRPQLATSSRIGSLQLFIPGCVEAADVLPGKFSVQEVQALAIFDIRTLNGDRHGGNVLVRQPTVRAFSARAAGGEAGKHADGAADAQRQLVPIDHSYICPSGYADPDYEWLAWPQTREPFTPACLAYIRALDAARDAELVRVALLARSHKVLRRSRRPSHACGAEGLGHDSPPTGATAAREDGGDIDEDSAVELRWRRLIRDGRLDPAAPPNGAALADGKRHAAQRMQRAAAPATALPSDGSGEDSTSGATTDGTHARTSAVGSTSASSSADSAGDGRVLGAASARCATTLLPLASHSDPSVRPQEESRAPATSASAAAAADDHGDDADEDVGLDDMYVVASPLYSGRGVCGAGGTFPSETFSDIALESPAHAAGDPPVSEERARAAVLEGRHGRAKTKGAPAGTAVAARGGRGGRAAVAAAPGPRRKTIQVSLPRSTAGGGRRSRNRAAEADAAALLLLGPLGLGAGAVRFSLPASAAYDDDEADAVGEASDGVDSASDVDVLCPPYSSSELNAAEMAAEVLFCATRLLQISSLEHGLTAREIGELCRRPRLACPSFLEESMERCRDADTWRVDTFLFEEDVRRRLTGKDAADKTLVRAASPLRR